MASRYKNSISYDKRDYTLPYSEISDENDNPGEIDECDSPILGDVSSSEVSSEVVYQIHKLRDKMSVCVFDMTDILAEDIDKFISMVRG